MSLNLLDLTKFVLYWKKLSISFQANDLIFLLSFSDSRRPNFSGSTVVNQREARARRAHSNKDKGGHS